MMGSAELRGVEGALEGDSWRQTEERRGCQDKERWMTSGTTAFERLFLFFSQDSAVPAL